MPSVTNSWLHLGIRCEFLHTQHFLHWPKRRLRMILWRGHEIPVFWMFEIDTCQSDHTRWENWLLWSLHRSSKQHSDQIVPHQQHFLDHEHRFYTKHVLLVYLVKQLSPYDTGRISEWMAFALIRVRSCSWDAFSGNAQLSAKSNVYKCDVIILKHSQLKSDSNSLLKVYFKIFIFWSLTEWWNFVSYL